MAIVVTALAVLAFLGVSLAVFRRVASPDDVLETRSQPSLRHQVRSRHQLDALAEEIQNGRAPALLAPDRDHRPPTSPDS